MKKLNKHVYVDDDSFRSGRKKIFSPQVDQSCVVRLYFNDPSVAHVILGEKTKKTYLRVYRQNSSVI